MVAGGGSQWNPFMVTVGGTQLGGVFKGPGDSRESLPFLEG